MNGDEATHLPQNQNGGSEITDTNNKRKLADADILQAKLKAQELAARILSDAENKRPRLDDSSAIDRFVPITSRPPSSSDIQKYQGQLTENSQSGITSFETQASSHYGFQGPSKKIEIPNGKVGVIIGKSGETIKNLQIQSGARIQVTKDMEANPYSPTRGVELFGTHEQISKAEKLINDVIAEVEAGGPARGLSSTSVPQGGEEIVVKVPNHKVAMVIGKGGETIKNMQINSGAGIQVIPLHLPPGDTSTERNVHIYGTKEQIELARGLVNEVVSGTRPRYPSLGNNQMQQTYYPPGNWATPVQSSIPQPGYAYTQPGAYCTPPPAYYGSYPPQPVGWDQSNTSAMPPQQRSGSTYYGQQDQTSAPASNTNLSYGQIQSTSQNYEGYSHQQQSYGQSTPAQVSQYDQRKACATSGYAAPNATQPGGTIPSQPCAAQSSIQPPAYQVPYAQSPTIAPTPAYGPQTPAPPLPSYNQAGSTQSGYGGQPPVHLSSSVQSQPPMSQPVYGQAGYPQQPPSQPYYYQTPTVYGQTNPQVQAQSQTQPQQSVYTPPPPLAYGAERNGDANAAAAAPNNGTASSLQEAAHSQS